MVYIISAGQFYWGSQNSWATSKIGAKRYTTYNKAVLGLRAAKKRTSATPQIIEFNIMDDDI